MHCNSVRSRTGAVICVEMAGTFCRIRISPVPSIGLQKRSSKKAVQLVNKEARYFTPCVSLRGYLNQCTCPFLDHWRFSQEGGTVGAPVPPARESPTHCLTNAVRTLEIEVGSLKVEPEPSGSIPVKQDSLAPQNTASSELVNFLGDETTDWDPQSVTGIILANPDATKLAEQLATLGSTPPDGHQKRSQASQDSPECSGASTQPEIGTQHAESASKVRESQDSVQSIAESKQPGSDEQPPTSTSKRVRKVPKRFLDPEVHMGSDIPDLVGEEDSKQPGQDWKHSRSPRTSDSQSLSKRPRGKRSKTSSEQDSAGPQDDAPTLAQLQQQLCGSGLMCSE